MVCSSCLYHGKKKHQNEEPQCQPQADEDSIGHGFVVKGMRLVFLELVVDHVSRRAKGWKLHLLTACLVALLVVVAASKMDWNLWFVLVHVELLVLLLNMHHSPVSSCTVA